MLNLGLPVSFSTLYIFGTKCAFEIEQMNYTLGRETLLPRARALLPGPGCEAGRQMGPADPPSVEITQVRQTSIHSSPCVRHSQEGESLQ